MSVSLIGQLYENNMPLINTSLLLTDPKGHMFRGTSDNTGQFCFADLTDEGQYTLYYSKVPLYLSESPDLHVMQKYCTFNMTAELLRSESPLQLTYCLSNSPLTPLVKFSLTPSEDSLAPGDTLHCQLTLSNISVFQLSHICIHDLLNNSLKFVPKSIYINCCNDPELSIISGIYLPDLAPSQSASIEFDASVLDCPSTTAVLTASCSYEYTEPSTHAVRLQTASAPPQTLHILTPSVKIEGSTSKAETYLDDTLTYSIIITNNGSLDILDLTINHHCSGCQLIEDSVLLNASPINGIDFHHPFFIGYLKCNETATLSFKVKVIGADVASELIQYHLEYSFMYHLPGHAPRHIQNKQYALNTPLLLSTFSQTTVENEFELPESMYDIKTVNAILLEFKIMDSNIIETKMGRSISGECLTGKELLIHLMLCYTIEYISDSDSGITATFHNKVPFTLSIALCPSTDLNAKYHINFESTESIYEILNNRCLYVASYILASAKLY